MSRFWIDKPPTWEPTDDEYYGAIGSKMIGSSSLKMFRQSRRLFDARYRGEVDPPKASDAMVLGSLVDHMLTSDAYYAKKFFRTDTGSRGDGRHVDGRTIVTSGMVSKAQSMMRAVMNHEDARRLFMGEGLSQVSHRWEDRQAISENQCWDCRAASHGKIEHLPGCTYDAVGGKTNKDEVVPLICRARWDRVVEIGGEPVAVELKSWNLQGDRERALLAKVRQFDTAEQLAHYERASDDLEWHIRRAFLVVVNSGDVPEVLVRELSHERMEDARQRVAQDLADMAQCMASNDWRSVCEREMEII